MPDSLLGAARPGAIAVAGAEARMFERGISLTSSLGETTLLYNFPSLLRPMIHTGGDRPPVFRSGVHVRHAAGQLDPLRPALTGLLEGRMFLRQKGQTSPAAALRLADAAPLQAGGGSAFQVEGDGILAHRQIYDVVIRTDDGIDQVVAPNALYYRDDWSNFAIAHITDMHVARRIDRFRGLLRQAGLDEAADRMLNWNDRFRGFVKFANSLHDQGKLDLILATGDLFDYIHEDDDDPAGGGNAEFLRQLILGSAPGPDFPDVEPLRVPIYGVPGNHDYRKHPYRLIFDLSLVLQFTDIGLKDIERVRNYSGYLLRSDEAQELANRLEGGAGTDIPNYSASDAGRMVAIDHENPAYEAHLGPRGSYVVALGPHKIAMLDTEWDEGVMESLSDGIRHVLGQTSEDERTFIGGSPNSHGIEDAEYDLTRAALGQVSNDALFIVGLHAPLLNPTAYPYFLRETMRPSQPDQTEAFLAGEDDAERDDIRSSHPTWFRPPNDHRDTRWVKRVDAADKLDFGVARGRGEDLIKLLAGVDAPRPANLVLAGHTHRHNEFVVRHDEGGQLAFYMDFYTQNPGAYYPTRYMKSWKNGEAPATDVTYVEVVPGSSPEFRPWSAPTGRAYAKVLETPPYPTPLNDSPNAADWWALHRPLILQTGALGPNENSSVSFSGFRIVTVENNVIAKINFISSDRLQQANYQLTWEDAVKTDPPSSQAFVGRSEQYGLPAAAGDPTACVMAEGVYDIIYRDDRNRLLELWKDTKNGASGAGNLTEVAQAPPAIGSPIPYMNTNANQLIVPYRAADGGLHSVYSVPGGTGHDDLGGVANAPKAAGDPVGFYTAETDLHHVIYRTSDGHLHAIYWQGNNAAAHEDLFWSSFPPATGDPAPYSGGGANIIAYRGADGEIHSLYWSGAGAAAHDALSAVAQMPHAAGDPVAYHYASGADSVNQVTYRAVDGQVIELWWVGAAPVQGWSVNGSIGAPPAASDPAAYYNSESQKKHVVYASADGHVHEVRWTPGQPPEHLDLTAQANAPLASGRPAAFFVASSNTRHVVYRSRDNQIIEIVLKYRRALPEFGGGAGGGVVVNA